jgi:RNA polymerase sigma factor (sigma-70 family)
MPSFSSDPRGPGVAELLAAAQRGEQQAWNGLVDRFGRLVWAVARSFDLGTADAADLSQTVWLRLVEHVHQVKEPERLGSWLATTTRREAVRMLRKRSIEIPDEDHEEQSDRSEDGPEETAMAADEHVRLRAALERLPERCRRLLRVIAASDEANYSEVAAALDMPVGSIGPTRSRCLERLRIQFDQST